MRIEKVSVTETGEGIRRARVLLLVSDALFPHFFPERVLERLEDVAEWSRYSEREDSTALRELIMEADALMTTWHSPLIREQMLGLPRRVRLIAHCGGEVKARIDEEVFNHVTVTNAPEPMALPVAEMAVAMMLALVRRLREYDGEMRDGLMRTNEYVSRGETVRGRRVGIVGFGRIGRAFARTVEPFGAELLVADPFYPAELVAGYKARHVDIEELLQTCSVVVLAAGLTSETRNILDARRLALMGDGAYLINVARGGLIEMEALLCELRAGRISAALDVTDPLEPLPPDHELRRLPNVLLTPHIAAGGIEMRQAIGREAAEEVVRFFRGEQPQNIVTREMLKTMT